VSLFVGRHNDTIEPIARRAAVICSSVGHRGTRVGSITYNGLIVSGRLTGGLSPLLAAEAERRLGLRTAGSLRRSGHPYFIFHDFSGEPVVQCSSQWPSCAA
jgi:hypothetical protein